MRKLIIILLLLTPTLVLAHDHPEKYYQDIECERIGGKISVYIPQTGTYADCVTEYVAVEVDFLEGLKGYEAIGQALHYSIELGLHPVIWLILENESSCKHLPKVMPVAAKYSIVVKQLGAYANKCTTP